MKFFKQSKGHHESVEEADTADAVHCDNAPTSIEGGWQPVARTEESTLWVVPADGGVLLVDACNKSMLRLAEGGSALGERVHYDVDIPADSTLIHHEGLLYIVSKGATVTTVNPSTGNSNYLCTTTGKYRQGTPLIFKGLLYFFGGQNDSTKKPSANIRAFDLAAEQWVAKTGFSSKLPFKDLNPLVLHTEDMLLVASRDGSGIVTYDAQLEVVSAVPCLEAPPGTLHVVCSGDTALFVTSEGIVGKQLVASGWSVFTPTLPPLIHANEIQALARTGPTLFVHLATTHEVWVSAPLSPLSTSLEFSPTALTPTPTKDKKKRSILKHTDSCDFDFQEAAPTTSGRSLFSRFSPRTKGYKRQLCDEPFLVSASAL